MSMLFIQDVDKDDNAISMTLETKEHWVELTLEESSEGGIDTSITMGLEESDLRSIYYFLKGRYEK